MKTGGHGRRLDGLEQRAGAPDGGWFAAVHRLDRERCAALALAQFAQALAGTEKPPPVRDDTPPPVELLAGPPAELSAPPPRRGPRVWDKNNRPGPHDVLTWDEVLRIPWLDANQSAAVADDET